MQIQKVNGLSARPNIERISSKASGDIVKLQSPESPTPIRNWEDIVGKKDAFVEYVPKDSKK